MNKTYEVLSNGKKVFVSANLKDAKKETEKLGVAGQLDYINSSGKRETVMKQGAIRRKYVKS